MSPNFIPKQESILNDYIVVPTSLTDFTSGRTSNDKEIKPLDFVYNASSVIYQKQELFSASYIRNKKDSVSPSALGSIAFKKSNSSNDKIINPTSFDNNSKSLVDDTATLFSLLKNEPFTPGNLSSADRFFEEKFKSSHIIYINSLLSKTSMLCYAQPKNYSYLHFLNLLKNATFYMSYDDLKLYAILSVAKNDCEIKDLAISLFESFNYPNSESLVDAISCLENTDTESYPWLTEYKEEIIDELKGEIGRI